MNGVASVTMPASVVPAGDSRRNTQLFQYDDLYRLTSVTYPGPSTTTYDFDAFGNRTEMVVGATDVGSAGTNVATSVWVPACSTVPAGGA